MGPGPGRAGHARAGRPSTELELRLAVSAVDESLTVTASYVDTPLSLLADSVSTLSRADLDARQITTLGDALRLVPGFTVARNGGPGTVTSIFPRGGESDYTMVLVDGVRMNAFGGGMDLSQVSIAGAERVEVVRGPQSALYGSDAIGGVVQVLTSRAGDPMLDALVEGGGRDARRVAGSARASLGDLYGTLSGQYMEDEGYTGTAPADGSTVSNDDSRVSDAAGRPRLAGGLGHRSVRHVPVPRLGSGLARAVRVESGRQLQRRRSRRPQPDVAPVGRRCACCSRSAAPPAGCGCGPRPTSSDFDLEYRDEFGSTGETDARPRPAAGRRGAGDWPVGQRRRRVGRRERQQHLHRRGVGEVPVERDVWAGVRRSALAADGAALVHRRCPGVAHHAGGAAGQPERLSRRGRPSTTRPSSTSTRRSPARGSSSPKAARRPPRRGCTARRAPASVRPDAFEIAFTDNDGLKPERSAQRRGRDHADAVWRRGLGRCHLVPQQLRRPDRLGRALQLVEPLHDRQHRQRAGPGRRIGAHRAAVGPVLGAGDLHLPRHRDPRRGRRRRRGAVAVRRRRPAAAPAAPPGQRRRGVVGRPACRCSGRW